MIVLEVGPNKERFTAHKDLLVSKSPYFEAALRPEFTEGQEEVVSWPEVDADVVPVFLNWVYSDKIRWCDTNMMLDDAINILGTLYVFADAFQMIGLADAVVKELESLLKRDLKSAQAWFDFLPPIQAISDVWEQTREGDAIRVVLGDYVAAYYCKFSSHPHGDLDLGPNLLAVLAQLPSELLAGCMQKMATHMDLGSLKRIGVFSL